VLFLDLDRFKQVNDAMGHDVGDRVLQMAAHRLAEHVVGNALLARWGGDEFVLVMGGGADLHRRAHLIAHELVNDIAQTFQVGGQSVSLGLSVGMSFFPSDSTDHQELILAADLAVAEVKRSGRGQVFDYCYSYSATQKRRFDVSRALGATVGSDGDELQLHFQPIVDAASGRIHAYEALARWRHPTLGPINPDEFIRVAEETDRIVALGDRILRQACEAATTWTSASHAPKVAVNVSVKQLREHGFALRVMQILTQTGLAPARLELEVTESLFADDNLEATREEIESLRALGVSFQIDDFGTGYSSLSRLQSLPVSAVKIDRSFVSDLEGRGAVIVESTLLIARRLGLSVIAEGVETQAQSRALRAMGVDLLQGFYFGKPEPHVLQTAVAEALIARCG
jgi:diguanylate cyclase (GGDEF)-like protein